MTVVPGCSAAAISAFSVTVSPRSVSTIGRLRLDGPVDLGVVAAVGRLDLEAERPQRGHVRLDGAGAEVAAAGVRQLEDVGAVEQRAEEHDDRAGTPRGLLVDVREVELLGRDDLEVVVVVEPAGLDAEAAEHLEQPVDLLDPGDLAQRGAAAVEQRGAEQRDPGVLGGLDVDAARTASSGPVTRRWVGPAPRATISESRAAPIRASISSERFWWPFSIRLIALWLVASSSASCAWVSPRCLRASRMRLPIRPL